MDLIYMSDAMAYQSIRGQFPYYDRAWEQKQANKEKYPQKTSVNQKPKKSSQHGEKGACQICKEQQRRALKAYIRTKSHEESNASCIIEENEEEFDHHNTGAKKT